MEALYAFEIPYLINLLLRFVILIFAIALIGLFAGLGIHKRRQLFRKEQDERLSSRYAQQLSALDAGHIAKIDSMGSMRDLVCLGRVCRDRSTTRTGANGFELDAPFYSAQLRMLKRAVVARNWGIRHQAIDTIANLQLYSLFDFLLAHSAVEKNHWVAGHCFYVCASLVRTGAQFDALAAQLDNDDRLSTNLVEGLSRVAIQRFRENQPSSTVDVHLTSCLTTSSHSRLFKIGLINAIGKEQLGSLKETLIGIAHVGAETPEDAGITLAVMRAIAQFGQYDELIRNHLDAAQPTTQVVALRSSIHCDDDSLHLVAQQLHSLHFDVRYAAAMTLAALGKRGKHFLQIAVVSTDRFAKNIAAFALAVE
jgi:hypothetical protein